MAAKARATICVAVCSILLALPASGRVQNFVNEDWSRKYAAAGSFDQATAMTLDQSNSFAFLVGQTQGPRGHNMSLGGFIPENKGPAIDFDNKMHYSDAFIARVEVTSGKVDWFYRIEKEDFSRFSAVSLSPDGSIVYAAGYINVKRRLKTILISVFEAETGKLRAEPTLINTGGNNFVRALVGSTNGFYLCGHTGGESFEELNTTAKPNTPVKGGILVAHFSDDGQLKWAKQGGVDRLSDFCSGIALSNDSASLSISATSFAKGYSGLKTGRPSLYKLHSNNGSLIWAKKIETSPGVEIVSSAIAQEENSLYMSAYVWADSRRGRRLYLYKVSGSGTLLWAKESCCGEVLTRTMYKGTANFNGLASAELTPGLFIGSDQYLYHFGYYQQAKNAPVNRYAAVLVRMSVFGDQDPNKDISLPLMAFQLLSERPIGKMQSKDGKRIFLARNSAAEGDVPELLQGDVTLDTVGVNARASQGAKTTNITFEIHSTIIPLLSVSDFIAEWLRVSRRDQVKTTSTSKGPQSHAEEGAAGITVSLFDDKESPLNQGSAAMQGVQHLFSRQLASSTNALESHFEVPAGTIVLKDNSLRIVTEEAAKVTKGFDGESALEEKESEGKTGTLKIVTYVAGSMAFVAFLGGFTFLTLRNGHQSTTSSLDGRPAQT